MVIMTSCMRRVSTSHNSSGELDLAKRRLRWMEEFDTVMDCDMNKGKINWFLGGKLNVSGNFNKVGVTIITIQYCR